MHYIYHKVPKGMQGNVLFPLNMLKETHPDVYAEEASKYAARDGLMQQTLPILNCLWNDVLHLSAVHPSVFKEALAEAGSPKSFNLEFFEIDPHVLNPKDTLVYLNNRNGIENIFQESNFVTYDPDKIAEYSVMPQETKDYYKEKIGQGKWPLMFHKVPYILYKGILDVSKMKRIEW